MGFEISSAFVSGTYIGWAYQGGRCHSCRSRVACCCPVISAVLRRTGI